MLQERRKYIGNGESVFFILWEHVYVSVMFTESLYVVFYIFNNLFLGEFCDRVTLKRAFENPPENQPQ